MAKINTLGELNELLFEQLRRIQEVPTDKTLVSYEIECAKAMAGIATQIINAHRIALDAAKFNSANPGNKFLPSFVIDQQTEQPQSPNVNWQNRSEIEAKQKEIQEKQVLPPEAESKPQDHTKRRRCSKCKEEKSIDFFDKNSSRCKNCDGIYKKEREAKFMNQ